MKIIMIKHIRLEDKWSHSIYVASDDKSDLKVTYIQDKWT